jgi:hypothetical protein
VGYSQKILDRTVVVDKEKIALGVSSGDVQADDGAKARTVHPGDFFGGGSDGLRVMSRDASGSAQVVLTFIPSWRAVCGRWCISSFCRAFP